MIAIIFNNKINNKYQHKNKQLQEVEVESVPAMACIDGLHLWRWTIGHNRGAKNQPLNALWPHQSLWLLSIFLYIRMSIIQSNNCD